MPSQITDFRYVVAGRLPDDFAAQWGAEVPCISKVYDSEPPESARLAFDPNMDTLLGAVRWMAMDSVGVSPNHGNQEIETRLSFLDDGQQIGPGLRISGTSPATANGYFLEFQPVAGMIGVVKYLAGTRSTVGSGAHPAIGFGPLRVRFRCFTVSGTTTLWARVWREGATEPGTWQINGATDTSSPLTDGGIGFGTADAVRYRVDVLSAATDAATAGAPAFSSIPRTFADMLAAEGVQLAWSARVESRIIATDVESVQWFGAGKLPQATAYTDCPCGAPMPQLLIDAKPGADTLNADLVFSGRTESSPPDATFKNTDAGADLAFDFSRTYAGRLLTIFVGEAAADADHPIAHRWSVPVSSGIIDGEPEIKSGDNTARFSLLSRSSPPNDEGRGGRRGIERSSEPMDVNRFVGIPTLLLAGIVTIPTNARMQIKSFTIFHRYLIDNAPASTSRISGIETSSTARQWRADIGTDGRIRMTASVGGVANVVDITTPLSVVGGHGWYAISIDAERNEALLLTERDEIYQGLGGGVVATPAAALMAGYGAGHYQLDLRFYDRALTAAEIRALADARDDGSSALAGSWRFDDGGAATTVTDYINGNNGTIAGTLNVNYFWMSSDLGEPDQAGRYMPMTEGHVFNAGAVLCNDGKKRWRWNDRPAPLEAVTGNQEFDANVVRVKGAVLTLGTDYTLPTVPAGAVIEFGGGDDTPVTFDTGFGSTPAAGSLLPGLLYNMGLRRSGLSPDLDLDPQSWHALRALFPWPAGYYSEGQADGWAQVAGEALAGVGAHVRDDRFGRIVPWSLQQTINPGPYGMAPHLEFLGSPGGGIRFPDLPALASNAAVTIVMWMKPHNVLGDSVAAVETQPFYQEFLSTFDADKTAGLAAGIHAGRDGSLIFAHSGVTDQLIDVGAPHSQTIAGKIRPDEWVAVAFKLTNFNGLPAPVGNYQSTIYGGYLGASAITEWSSLTVHGTRAAGTSLRIGSCFAGAISHVVIYAADLNAAALTPILTAPPSATSAIFYAALNEGSGRYVRDSISGAYGTVTGAQWCPQLVLDPAAGSIGVSESARLPLPAWRAGTVYAVNQSPLTESDITGSVTDRGERAHLRDPSMVAELYDRAIRDRYRQSRNFDVTSPLIVKAHAVEVSRAIRARFAEGLRGVTCAGDARVLALPLCSEVWYKDAALGDTGYRPYRVVTKDPPGLTTDTASLALWFGKDPG